MSKKKTGKKDTQKSIPDVTFDIPIDALRLPKMVCSILEEEGYKNVGELISKIEAAPEAIIEINGIGPKIFEQIEVALTHLKPKEITTNPPAYSPPVPSLADYYTAPPGSILAKAEKQKQLKEAQETEGETPTYNPPVPSLSDFFNPKKRGTPQTPKTKKETGKNKKK